MKHLILLLTALLCLCGGVRADTILINPYGLVTPAFPYLVNEGFEGTGTPANWYNNAVGDVDYSASPLIGAQSFNVAANAVNLSYIGTAIDHSEIFVKFRLKITARPVSPPYARLFLSVDASSAIPGDITILDTGVMVFGCNGNQAATTDALVTGTPYWVYMRIRSGVGSAGQIAAGFTEVETRPTSGTKYGYTTGNGAITTTNVTGFGFVSSAGLTYVMDNIQVAATIFD